MFLDFFLHADTDQAQEAIEQADYKFQHLAKTAAENKIAHSELNKVLNDISSGSLPLTSEVMDTLALAEQRASIAAKEFAESQEVAGRATTGLREKIRLTSEGLKGQITDFGTFGGALGALVGVGFLGEYINKLKEAVLQTEHLSETTGISVGDLTRMKDAMEEAGVKSDLLDRALPRLYTHIFEAGHQSKIAAEAFEMLGIHTDKWTTQMPSAVDVLKQISAYIEKYGVDANTAAAISEIFGLRSQQVAAILPQLIASLKDPAFAAHAAAMEKEVDAANALEEAEGRLKMQMDTLLLPSIEALSEILTHLGVRWHQLVLMLKVDWAEFVGLAKFAKDNLTGHYKEAENDLEEMHKKILADTVDFQTAMNDALKPPPGRKKPAPDPELLQQYLEKQKELKEQEKEEKAEKHKLVEEQKKYEEWIVKTMNAQTKAHERKIAEAVKEMKKPPAMDTKLATKDLLLQAGDSMRALTAATREQDQASKQLTETWNKNVAALQKDTTASGFLKDAINLMVQAHKAGLSVIQAFGFALRDEGKDAEATAKQTVAANAQTLLSHLMSRKAMAITEAIVQTARGIADLAFPPKPWSAAMHFLSAAEWAKVAGSSGGSHGGGGGSASAESAQHDQSGTQGTVGGSRSGGGGGGGGSYHSTSVNIYGGQITDTHNLQALVTTLNAGGQSGAIRLNTGGTSATIPAPAY